MFQFFFLSLGNTGTGSNVGQNSQLPQQQPPQTQQQSQPQAQQASQAIQQSQQQQQQLQTQPHQPQPNYVTEIHPMDLSSPNQQGIHVHPNDHSLTIHHQNWEVEY